MNVRLIYLTLQDLDMIPKEKFDLDLMIFLKGKESYQNHVETGRKRCHHIF